MSIPCVDAATMQLHDLQVQVADSIARHEPLIVKNAFPFGISVSAWGRCKDDDDN